MLSKAPDSLKGLLAQTLDQTVDVLADVYPDNAYERVMVRQLRERILARVAELPEREAIVIRYHYLQRLSFDEIGERFGVTKGRVSQIHRAALRLLRKSLGDLDGLDIQM